MNITMAQEDYLETIYDLSHHNAEVKSIDVARVRNVSRASINKAIPGLLAGGFIEHEPYGKLILTEKGCRIAKEVRRRHNILKSFLVNILKVDEEIAEDEACRIEHIVSGDTIKKICEYLEQHEQLNTF